MCAGGAGGGLKNSQVVSLNLEDTVKSLWQSQQLEFSEQAECYGGKSCAQRKSCGDLQKVPCKSSTKYQSAYIYVMKLPEARERPLKRIRRSNYQRQE